MHCDVLFVMSRMRPDHALQIPAHSQRTVNNAIVGICPLLGAGAGCAEHCIWRLLRAIKYERQDSKMFILVLHCLAIL